jgi:hypothetical protein
MVEALDLQNQGVHPHPLMGALMVASAGETDRDSAAMQFTKNCFTYNIIEFQTLHF